MLILDGNKESLISLRVVQKLNLDTSSINLMIDVGPNQYIKIIDKDEDSGSEHKELKLEPTDSKSNFIENGTKSYYTLTAYTAGIESTGKTPDHPAYGITSSGASVKENHTIACPKNLEFGTKVYIPSLNTIYTCEDRGGAIKGNRLDIYIENLDDAYTFGVKKDVEVYILTYK